MTEVELLELGRIAYARFLGVKPHQVEVCLPKKDGKRLIAHVFLGRQLGDQEWVSWVLLYWLTFPCYRSGVIHTPSGVKFLGEHKKEPKRPLLPPPRHW